MAAVELSISSARSVQRLRPAEATHHASSVGQACDQEWLTGSCPHSAIERAFSQSPAVHWPEMTANPNRIPSFRAIGSACAQIPRAQSPQKSSSVRE